MKRVILALGFMAAGMGSAALAATADDMVGKWKWTNYTVDVKKCDSNPSGAGLCATVAAGPKNVGMEMIRSKLEAKDGGFFGKIAHPETGAIYNTKMTLKGKDSWSMDGCTDANVCAKGEFQRIK
jgi:uncharacterized protein (DUF2147 family)